MTALGWFVKIIFLSMQYESHSEEMEHKRGDRIPAEAMKSRP
jgi:hypothetical protein